MQEGGVPDALRYRPHDREHAPWRREAPLRGAARVLGGTLNQLERELQADWENEAAKAAAAAAEAAAAELAAQALGGNAIVLKGAPKGGDVRSMASLSPRTAFRPSATGRLPSRRSAATSVRSNMPKSHSSSTQGVSQS
jgi:hypothetical protein